MSKGAPFLNRRLARPKIRRGMRCSMEMVSLGVEVTANADPARTASKNVCRLLAFTAGLSGKIVEVRPRSDVVGYLLDRKVKACFCRIIHSAFLWWQPNVRTDALR